MSERENKGVVPVLRFPEFRDADEWEEYILGDKSISLFVKEKAPIEQLELESYISTENILPDYAGITTASKLPPNGSFTSHRKGDILISNIRPYLKKVWAADKNGTSSNDIVVIRAGIKVSNSFLTFWLKNDEFISYIMKTAKGVKMPRGDISSMKEYSLAVPTPKEQQKIADCLSSLDELIAAHTQKHEALKAHKKGLMQQLFPAEGETVPELRFPEFRDAGEWEEVRLEDIGEFTGGGTPSKSRSDYWNGDVPWVSSSDLIDDSIHQLKISRFITVEAIKASATKLVPVNTILLVSRVGVGKLAITNKQVCTSQDFTNFTPIEDNLVFLAYYLKTRKSKFLSFNQGMAIKGFTKDDVATLNLRLPDFNEQQKIADCLSSIDDLITAQSEKIESLKDHKKGLMQQLFPVQAEQAGESLPEAAQA